MDPLKSAILNFAENTQPEIEFIPRLSEPVINVLNTQIKNELYSANLYKTLASWCSDAPWTNGFKLFMKYGNEEIHHADKIIEYLDDKNCKIVISDIPKPPCECKSIRDVLVKSLEHEIGVTKNWENIADVALKNKDNTTYEFAQWFIKEQVEEEVKFKELLYKLDLGMPYWELDTIFGEML